MMQKSVIDRFFGGQSGLKSRVDLFFRQKDIPLLRKGCKGSCDRRQRGTVDSGFDLAVTIAADGRLGYAGCFGKLFGAAG